MNTHNDISTVIWDADNTIWSWMEFAVPAYEAMCQTIAGIAGRSFEESAAAMKVFYSARATLEDEGLIQGLRADGFFDHVADFDQERVIHEAQRVFSAVRRQRLRVYPGIGETIQYIHERGIRQVIVTDAPARQARARLRHSGISSSIEKVFTMPSAVIPDLPHAFQNPELGLYELAHSVLEDEKPNTNLEHILKLTREAIAREVVIIGDNLAKDMALAEAYGCRGIHAAYGVAHPDLVARIQQFAPARVTNRNTQSPGNLPLMEGQPRDFGARMQTARSPSDILDLLFSISALG